MSYKNRKTNIFSCVEKCVEYYYKTAFSSTQNVLKCSFSKETRLEVGAPGPKSSSPAMAMSSWDSLLLPLHPSFILPISRSSLLFSLSIPPLLSRPHLFSPFLHTSILSPSLFYSHSSSLFYSPIHSCFIRSLSSLFYSLPVPLLFSIPLLFSLSSLFYFLSLSQS